MRKAMAIFLFLSCNAYAQWTNFRIHPSGSNQIEPSIVAHQTNPMIMFASAFTIRQAFRSEGVYVTTDGGISWFGSDTCSGTPIANHGGDPGPIIDKNGRFILTHQGTLITGMYSNYSDDLGLSWSSNYQIASGDQDKGAPGTDDVQSSSFYGRTYLVWTRYIPPFPIVISWTDNGAISWTPQLQINNTPGGHVSQGPYISVGPSGQAYVCWAASISTSPFNEDFIGFAVSTNGGSNWNVSENAYDCNGIKSSSLQPWGIRVNGYPYMDVNKTGGSENGWIYIVESEKNLAPAGNDPDVIFHRSTNGGQSWSQGIRVNQDALNNGKVQLFPAIEVDNGGGLNVIYLDNRNAAADTLMGVFLSRSVDGGNTWADYQINDHWFRPRTAQGGSGGNQGDNIGITSANGKLFPVWMDNSIGSYPGLYQVWTALIDINTIGIKQISAEVPKEFKLEQNYPNPFNASSKFKFQISKLSKAKVIIYDLRGRDIATLVNQDLKPGTYEVEWNASDFPSGIYLYQLIVSGFTETKKMVLVK